MAHIDDEDLDFENDKEKVETLKFNAETHLAFSRDNFDFLSELRQMVHLCHQL